MTTGRLSMLDLPWLPRLAPDFKTRLGDIEAAGTADWGPAMSAMAGQHLGLSQAIALSRKLRQLRSERTSPALTRFKLGLVSNATVDFIVPMLEATGLRYGLSVEVVTGPFDQAMQEALDPTSFINMAKPDAVLIALDHRGLPFRQDSCGVWPPFRVESALERLNAIRDGFRRHSGSTCMVQTIPATLMPQFGSLDAGLSGTLRRALGEFNEILSRDAPKRGDVVVDVDWLAQTVGLYDWYDDRDWHLAKMPFSQKALAAYAEFVVRPIAAMRGKSRKCLVLDLDNTLWGGVIGDDGIEGISLDQGDARGEAHRAVQAAALDLRRRGIVLAVCSKNDDETARIPFKSHAGMLLKEDDIAVFIANWEDKATNLERIAKSLDIGLDALVLLDDNPAERAQVRQALPQIAVPELGDDPSTFARTLMLAGYFESIAFTPEDLIRADQYTGNAHRAELLESSRDLGDFLRSLDMTIQFAPFRPANRKRITQLINKTNQFNLTTRRYTETQVSEIEASSAHFTLQAGLIDRFGDNGMICAVICHRRQLEWEIDSWLMSCRVLNRKVEEAVCNHVARAAILAGAETLVGVYRPTARNQMVAELYARLGFLRAEDVGDEQRWRLELRTYREFDVPMAEAG